MDDLHKEKRKYEIYDFTLVRNFPDSARLRISLAKEKKKFAFYGFNKVERHLT